MRLTSPTINITEEQQLAAELVRIKVAEAQKSAKAEHGKKPKKERSLADKALHDANKLLNTSEFLRKLKAELPEVYRVATVSGQWTWIEFPMKPHDEVLAKLFQLGCAWSKRRHAWYHAGGTSTGYSKGDPRMKYGNVAAAEFEEDPQPIILEPSAGLMNKLKGLIIA